MVHNFSKYRSWYGVRFQCGTKNHTALVFRELSCNFWDSFGVDLLPYLIATVVAFFGEFGHLGKQLLYLFGYFFDFWVFSVISYLIVVDGTFGLHIPLLPLQWGLVCLLDTLFPRLCTHLGTCLHTMLNLLCTFACYITSG